MLLRATDVLAQHSAGKDSSGNTAVFYTNAGLDLLQECDGMFCCALPPSQTRICSFQAVIVCFGGNTSAALIRTVAEANMLVSLTLILTHWHQGCC